MDLPDEPAAPTADARPGWRRRLARIARGLALVLVIWLSLAYLILPALWRHYEHHPALADAPKTTLTSQGIPGDPLNVGLIGRERDVIDAMLAAGWVPADPVTLRSSLEIAESVVLRRPDPNAPVSSLFLFGRKQDLAFEKPVGGNASRRHHVRFWKAADLGDGVSPLFIGSATFDVKVGFSHDTGAITHHIAPDIDAQRDELIDDLTQAGRLARIDQVTGVGSTLLGYNGEGDRYYTDGELTIGELTAEPTDAPPGRRPNPPTVRWKDQLWTAIRPLLSATTPLP